MSSTRLNNLKKFYHASPYRLKYGTVLQPGIRPLNFNEDAYYQEHGVFLSTHPNPHITIRKAANLYGWHVYEVEPIGSVRLGSWHDLVCSSVVVVKYVGSARGLISKYEEGSVYKGGCNRVIKSGKYWRHPNVHRNYERPFNYVREIREVQERIMNPCDERKRLYSRLGISVSNLN